MDTKHNVTRRLGARLAAAGTAALAALPLGVAAASEDDDRGRDRDDRLRGLERSLEAREEALRRFRERLEDRLDRIDDLDGAFSLGDFGARGAGAALRLFRVVDVNGDDFDRGADPQNRDALRWGAIRLDRENSADARIQVFLDGAAANASYEVFFARFNNKAREQLGWVRTNGSGDVATLARSGQDNTGDVRRTGGGIRVGLYVLTRDGRDQFVTALATRST
jgi:hypothetical protein